MTYIKKPEMPEPKFLKQYRAEALELVNKIRAHYGLPPRKRLSTGIRGKAYCCPVSNSITRDAGDIIVSAGTCPSGIVVKSIVRGRAVYKKWKCPINVEKFISAFDFKCYPKLERKPRKSK